MREKNASKSHNGEIKTLPLRVAVHVDEQRRIGWDANLLAEGHTLPRRSWLVRDRIHAVLQNVDGQRRSRQAGLQVCLPALREAQDAVYVILNAAEETHVCTLVHLVEVDPDFEGLGHVLDGLQELVHHDGIVVDHDNIGRHGLDVLLELIEAKSVLAGLLVGRRVVLHDIREWANGLRGTNRRPLEAKVKNLDNRVQRRQLLQKVVRHLRVPRRLLRVRADQ